MKKTMKPYIFLGNNLQLLPHADKQSGSHVPLLYAVLVLGK